LKKINLFLVEIVGDIGKKSALTRVYYSYQLIIFVILTIRKSNTMSTSELLKDFFSFLRKPHASGLSVATPQRLLYTFKLWCCLFLFIIFGGALLDSLIEVPVHDRFEEVMEQIGVVGFIVFAVLVGPLLEEIAFRLAMRFRLRTVLIGVTAFVIYMTQAASQLFGPENSQGLLILGIGATVALLGFVLLCVKRQNAVKAWWTNHFPWVFYIFSIAFALIHIFNFEEFPLKVILLTPIITLPQLILGLGMGYLRMRFGFWYGYLFHVLNNAFAVTVFLLITDLKL